MLQKQSTLYASIRNYVTPAVIGTAALLTVASPGWADGFFSRFPGELNNDRASRLVESIPVPASPANNTAGGMYSFDISWVDQADADLLSGRSLQCTRRHCRRRTSTFLGQINATHPPSPDLPEPTTPQVQMA